MHKKGLNRERKDSGLNWDDRHSHYSISACREYGLHTSATASGEVRHCAQASMSECDIPSHALENVW